MTFDHRPARQPSGRPAPAAAGSSLTMTKLAAGGLAAATSAVLGSYFGVLGTVGGAAAGSVATALSGEIYQRSFERLGGRRGTAPRRRTLPRLLLGAVVIFALGIGMVTGVEWVKGGPLSGGSRGTSLGRVLGVDLLPSSGGLIAPSDGSKSHDSGPHDQETRDHGVLGDLISGAAG
jgi:hypothetical protein